MRRRPLRTRVRVGATARRRIQRGGPRATGRPAASLEEWAAIRRAVFRRARWRCQACGRWGALEVHHVIKRAQGDSDFDLDHLVALCPPCHAQTDAPYARGGWSSLRWATGASPPRSPEGLMSRRSARSRAPSMARARDSRRSRSCTAVDAELNSRDVVTVLGAEIDAGSCDLPGFAEALHRDLFREACSALVEGSWSPSRSRCSRGAPGYPRARVSGAAFANSPERVVLRAPR
jgi:5-methylcytosine-specific restriction endonuclease McrA